MQAWRAAGRRARWCVSSVAGGNSRPAQTAALIRLLAATLQALATSACAQLANTGSLGFARPRVLPSCWRRYLPPTARAWLPVSGWGARAARTSADIVAPCGVGQTRRRRWSWRRTFGASRDRSSARGSVGELCRLYLEAVGWVGQASRCATRINAAARAIAAYAPRTAIAASGVSSPAERCTVMAACTAVPGRY